MKKRAVLILTCFLFVSCVPATPSQVNQIDNSEYITIVPTIIVQATKETAAPEKQLATERPTQTPTKNAPTCVSLLEPINGVTLPPIGKVTFSWTPKDNAGTYILKIILPSGNIASFETEQTFRIRYMETLTVGGNYHWQVIAQDTNGNEICESELSTFEKPEYQKPDDIADSTGDTPQNNNNSEGASDACIVESVTCSSTYSVSCPDGSDSVNAPTNCVDNCGNPASDPPPPPCTSGET